MSVLAPSEIAETVARLRAEGASMVTVRVTRGGTLEVIAKWPDETPPQRPVIRPR